MKVSINWIREINKKYKCSADPMPKGIDNLVEKIGAQLGAVEEVVDLGRKYQGIVVAKVMECVSHPNADKLSLCLIDDGGVVKKVKRVPWPQATRASTVSVRGRVAEEAVGGTTATEQRSPEAENVPKHGRVDGSAGKQDMRSSGLVQVVCGAPNATAGQLVAWIPPGVTVPSTVGKEPFVLEAREIRGKVSNGMIASMKELDLGDNHTGILVLAHEKNGEWRMGKFPIHNSQFPSQGLR
ncbi:hypothetical protein HYS42_00010 [Candidatus Saccharibacteria bacterium]|nr:hypothetical protein [Candidatus Saccharibacteria bacterium]